MCIRDSAVGDEPVDEVVGHGPGDGLVVGDDLRGEDWEQELSLIHISEPTRPY